MRTDVTNITERGGRYAFGRGPDFYGIYDVDAIPSDAPLERFPLTPEGWYEAWSRYQQLERGVDMDSLRSVATAATAPAALLTVLGVVLSVIGLFPNYYGGASLASQGDQVFQHVAFVIGWTAAFVLLLTPRTREHGAMLSLGVTAVSLGLFIGDIGFATSAGESAGGGLALSCVGWVCCAGGCLIALAAHPATTAARRRPRSAGALLAALVGSLGAAVTFFPSWDSYRVSAANSHSVEHETIGNAFSDPHLAIAGYVISMLALVVIAVLAARVLAPRLSAPLLIGGVVVLIGQVASAVAGVAEAPPFGQLGVSSATASATSISVASSLTPDFYLFTAFTAMLAALGVGWLMLRREPTSD